jgi:signal transduction histidine kinase
MQFLEALEEYLGTSRYLPMLPYTLRKFLNTPHHTLEISNTLDNSPHNDPNTFRSEKNNGFKSTSLIHRPKKLPSTISFSNQETLNYLGKEELTCIPIVSDEKLMGVVTEEQNTKAPSPSEPESVPSDRLNTVLHEINTPLSIIKNYMHILGNKLSQHNIAQDEIRIIKEEIDRVSHLLNGLRTCSGSIPKHTESVNINKQTTDLIKILEEPLAQKSNIQIKLNLDTLLPPFYAKKDSVKQILINLIKNSVDAMPDGGCLNIQTKYIRHPDTNKQTNPPHIKGSLEIIISDTGTGIPSDIEPKIFEPSISSKKKNHFGIGLSIVRDIVESLNGKISCKNNKDKGATFNIIFPLYDSELHSYRIPE